MRYTSPPGVSPSLHSSAGGAVPSSALSTSSIDPPSPVAKIHTQAGKEFTFPPPYRCTINGWASLIEFVPYSASQPQQMVISSAASNQAQNYSLWRPGAGSSLAHSSSVSGESSSMTHVAVPFRLLMSPYDMSRVERSTPFFRNQGNIAAGSSVGAYSRSLHSRAGGAFPSSISSVLLSEQGTRQRLRSVGASASTISQSHSDILQQRAAQRQGYEWQDAQSSSSSSSINYSKGGNENSTSASFGSSAPAFSSSTFLSSRSSSSFPSTTSTGAALNGHRVDTTHQGSSNYNTLSRTSLSSLQQPLISTYAQQQVLSPRVTTRGQGGSNLIFSSPRAIGHAGNTLMASSGQIMSPTGSANRPFSPTSSPPYSGALSPRGLTQQTQRRGPAGVSGGSPFLSPYASSRDSRSRASPSRGRWDE